MISPKFYSQVNVCPACLGWGGKDCKECGGQGVTVTQSKNIYVWNAPTFVDYKTRNKILILKIISIILAISLLMVFILFIKYELRI